MDIEPNELKDLVVRTATAVSATGVVGGGMLWLMREKLAAWGRALTRPKFAEVDVRLKDLEVGMSDAATDRKLLLQTLTGVAKSVEESTARQTVMMERMADKQDETAQAVAAQGAMIQAIRDVTDRRSKLR